jgi:hypothetical protein
MRVTEKRNIAPWQSDGTGKPTCMVKLGAVGAPDNKTWSEATPSGSVELSISNTAAYDAFTLGEFYFVDFTVAPAKEADEGR